MEFDVRSPEGELDRAKVIAKLDAILSFEGVSVGTRIRLINLLDDTANVARAEGYSQCQDVA